MLYIELAVLCATRTNYIWIRVLQPNRLVKALKNRILRRVSSFAEVKVLCNYFTGCLVG